ncbi:hypothetical protein F4808DRAFT_44624 [Astrocystis sublimbata]|nr:hypothetical protein F4808DRAFT_44624 [Astrocystis sublimbata]
MPIELPVLTVVDAAAWASWLVRSAASSKGVWLTLAKRGNTSPTSLTYGQALDEALCQGWIDGQARAGDERTYAQRFTPRAPKSLWSARNVEHVARLSKEGRVGPLGRAAVDAAKADGRWDAAYAGQSNAECPPEFLAAVAAVPDAQAMWDCLNKSNRFAIYFRLKALKTEKGKEKRIQAFVDMLARGESLLPQKQKQKPKPGTATADETASEPEDRAKSTSQQGAGTSARKLVATSRKRRAPSATATPEGVRRSTRRCKAVASASP